MTTVSIGTVAEWNDFAGKINDGTYTPDTDAVLTSDLNFLGETFTSIGSSSVTYTGTLDGNGHTVSNVGSSSSRVEGQLIISSGTLRKIHFLRCYVHYERLLTAGTASQVMVTACDISFTESSSSGHIINATICTDILVQNCRIEVYGTTTAFAGSSTATFMYSGNTRRYSNSVCINNTYIQTNGINWSTVTGFGGDYHDSASPYISNCVWLGGTLTCGSPGTVYKIGKNHITNCYAVDGGSSASGNDGLAITAEIYEQENFWNNVGVEVGGVTYRCGLDFTNTWDWDAANKKPKLRGFDVQIRTAQDLVDFAARVNAGETNLDAQLLANIDLAGYPALRIGNDSNKYAGTFDGKGHSIKLCSTIDFGGLGYYYLFYGDPTAATIVNTKFTDIICHRSNSSNYADSDTSFYVIAGFKSASRLLFDTVYLSNYPNQFRAGRWGGMGLCSATNVSDCMVINVTELSCQYPALLSGTRLSDCYLIGSATIHGGGSGSPSAWAQARPVYGDNGVTISNVFTKFTNIDGTAYDKSRIAGKPNSSWQSGYPTIVNCYAADTFLIDGSAVTSGTTTNQHGLSVSSTIYSQKGFWDGTGVNGTTYLSWDFVNTWYWDATDKLPKLRAFVVQISTMSELMGFARRVNDGETSIDGLLTADIDATGVTWVTIGDSSQPFDGTLDGDGHTISNLNEIFMICRNSRVSRIKFYNCILDFTSRSNYSALLFSAIPTTECTFEEIWIDTCTFKYFCPSGCYGASSSIFAANGTTVNISDIMATNCTLDSTGYDNGCGGGGVVALVCGMATTINMENCYLNGIYFGTPHGKRDTNISAVFYGGSFAMEVEPHTHTIDECLFIGTSTQGYVYATHNTVVSNLTKMYYDVTSARGHVTSYWTNYCVDGTEVTHDLVNQQGFYDGTGIAGTTYLAWDFVDTWEWDATTNTPILKIFARNSAPTVKIWNGSAWVDGTPHVWNGSAWKQADKVYVFTENGWVEKS